MHAWFILIPPSRRSRFRCFVDKFRSGKRAGEQLLSSPGSEPSAAAHGRRASPRNFAHLDESDKLGEFLEEAERRRSSNPLSALPHSEELGVKAFNGFQETQKKEKRRFLEDVREHLEMQLGVSKKVFGHLDIQEELEQRQDLYGKMRYKVHLMLKDQKLQRLKD